MSICYPSPGTSFFSRSSTGHVLPCHQRPYSFPPRAVISSVDETQSSGDFFWFGLRLLFPNDFSFLSSRLSVTLLTDRVDRLVFRSSSFFSGARRFFRADVL